MSAEDDFIRELEIFNGETNTAARSFYQYISTHHTAGENADVATVLNNSPWFWNTALAALLATTMIALARVFDHKSKHNLATLLSAAQVDLGVFSPESFKRRRFDADPARVVSESQLKNVVVPAVEEFRAIEDEVDAYREWYQDKCLPLRNHVLAHRVLSSRSSINERYARIEVDKLCETLGYLLDLHRCLWNLLHNGNALVVDHSAFLLDDLLKQSPRAHRPRSVQGRTVQETRAFLLGIVAANRKAADA